MRVLAIRGRNLASLAGNFAIDFEAEPLVDAGIFAIIGPTGAGKSTLLDAMCLALFGTIPRLGAAPSGAKMGQGADEGVSASDPRLILRHGTGEGFAEIDFATHDGGRYRARWNVARARHKPGGKLQQVQHSFERLDTGERRGGTRTETLQAIRDIIGLSPEQFGRAVMLAQGEFEAFIRADANERALLLERLTGSQVYARLGKLAFEKATALRQQQQALRDRIADRQGMDNEQRAQAEAHLAAAVAAIASLDEELKALEADQRWELQRTELAAKVVQCAADHRTGLSAQNAALPRREALARRKRALAFAPAWHALHRAGADRDDALGKHTAAAQNADLASAAVMAASEQQAGTQAALDRADTEAATLAPLLEQARDLDRVLAEADRTIALLAGDYAGHAAICKRLQDDDDEARTALTTAQAARDVHTAWLAANPAAAMLAQREEELAGQLDEQAALSCAIAVLVGRQSQQRAMVGERDDERTAASTAATAAEAEHGDAARTLAKAESAAPAESTLAALNTARDRLAALQPLLIDWQHADEAVSHADSALAEARAQVVIIDVKSGEAQLRHTELAAELPLLRARRDEVRRMRDLSEAAADDAAAALRIRLTPGDPCPVCGSADHDLAAIGALIGPLDAIRARMAELDGECSALEREDAALTTTLKSLSSQRDRLTDEIVHKTTALGKAIAQRDNALALVSTAAAAAGIDRPANGVAALMPQRLAEADAQRTAAQDARRGLDAARLAEQAARQTLGDRRSVLAQIETAGRDAAQVLASTEAALAVKRDALLRLTAIIDRTIGGAVDWTTHTDPAAWLRAEAQNWRDRNAAGEQAAAALPALEQAVLAAHVALTTATALADAVAKRLTAARIERDDHAATRRILLDGRTVEAVTDRLATARSDACQQVDAATAALAKAREDSAGAASALTAAAQRLAECEGDLAGNTRDLDEALATAGLGHGEVGDIVSAGDQAVVAEDSALAELDRAVEVARVTLEARQQDAARHEAGEIPALLGAGLIAAIASATTACDNARQQANSAQMHLRHDDEVRAKTAELRAELERESAAARVWLQLEELIGDREGKKFRRFAQGLTLDRLLGHANARLADLKPRYSLQRGQGGDMLIQVVDHDMAGEVRGLHNLSGGERFLASLALALGLAEMSTGRGVRIESLFIDEGFGALDTASLGQAISVLEQLHAGGRRVGVISHVEELKERIPVKIEVSPVARGRSEIVVLAE